MQVNQCLSTMGVNYLMRRFDVFILCTHLVWFFNETFWLNSDEIQNTRHPNGVWKLKFTKEVYLKNPLEKTMIRTNSISTKHCFIKYQINMSSKQPHPHKTTIGFHSSETYLPPLTTATIHSTNCERMSHMEQTASVGVVYRISKGLYYCAFLCHRRAAHSVATAVNYRLTQSEWRATLRAADYFQN